MDIYGTRLQKIIIYVTVISFSVFLILTSLYLFLYNPRFYNYHYAKNGIYEQFGYEKTWDATKELWKYMQFKEEFTSDFYSERDKRHMIDVRNILLGVKYVFFAAIIILLLCLLYYYSFSRNSFHFFLYDVFYSTGTFTIIILITLVIAAFFFDTSFFLFHRLFFFNDYWLLNPATDRLIVLFPENFFLTIFWSILGAAFVFAVIVFGISLYVKKRF